MGRFRISAGTTKGFGTAVAFESSGGIQFGYSSHTVTASPVPVKMYEFGKFESANSVTGSSNAINLSLQRFHVPAGIVASRLDLLAHVTVVGSTNCSYTVRAAAYTMNGSTAGTYATMSATVGFSSGGATDSTGGYSGQSGTQWRSYDIGTWNMTPGEYMLGIMASVNGPSGTTGSLTFYGGSAISIANGQAIGAAANPVNAFAGGIFSAGTASPPASIHISDVNRTGSYALAQPGFRLVGSF